jgi:hypothetical protein
MTLLFNKQHTMEPGPCSLFPNFTGGGATTCLSLTVDGGSEEFVVGDLVVGGTSEAFGTIYRIDSSSGVWDGDTSSGTAILILVDVDGSFQNNEVITGGGGSAAVADGTGTAGTIPGDPTDVKGKGIASIEASDTLGDAGRYTITLRDQWAGLLMVKACYLDADSTDDWEVTVVSEAVATTKEIVILVFKSGGASYSATDEKLYLELVLATSSMMPKSY